MILVSSLFNVKQMNEGIYLESSYQLWKIPSKEKRPAQIGIYSLASGLIRYLRLTASNKNYDVFETNDSDPNIRCYVFR